MIGNNANVQNLAIELDDLILPQNLLAEESLSPDAEPEEEERHPFWVDTSCGTCSAGVRICIFATSAAVQTLQLLLQRELAIVCTGCSKGRLRHGRHS